MQISGKSFAAGVLVTLVLSSGSAVAATGGKFILGGSNTANRASTLSNSAGTALALNSKSGTPPLRVNRTVKVANLNVDRLDGLDSTSLALKSGRTGLRWSTEVVDIFVDGDAIPDGKAAGAFCPAGTVVTGGSAFSYSGAHVADNFKDDANNAWVAITFDTAATAQDFGANVVCYNPRGAVAPQARTARERGAGDAAALRGATRRAIR